ncbi:tetratricopeptide repeat protein [Edaphobacter sp. HDX4]|uniref:tetratricopeptide repeat protein n=1 Tax=Edaphobacter sp. HDX4 TaxID=2794064 RepID=UPI002FE6B3B1
MAKNTATLTTRRVIFRDSITFLSLTAITVVLFVVTLFLFRSFQQHRTELAKRWSDRGVAALQANRPDQAVTCYRTALSYAPGERSYELNLAEALAQAGRTEEAYNYFIGLREARPGDGFINLQLARLAATKHDAQGAVNFYRASIYGDWEGDGAKRRRDVRLELARYLIKQKQLGPAKTELLVVGGNAPDDPELDVTLANLLEQVAAPSDAMDFFQKALVHQPDNQIALSEAGRLAYRRGDYSTALALLERAVKRQPGNEENTALLMKTRRILQLIPSETLRAPERVDRILIDRAIAKARWNACAMQSDVSQNSLQSLAARWMDPDATASRSALLHDSDKQKAALQLIYDTEIQTSQHCGAPTGDDALLLLLAQSSATKGGSH